MQFTIESDDDVDMEIEDETDNEDSMKVPMTIAPTNSQMTSSVVTNVHSLMSGGE